MMWYGWNSPQPIVIGVVSLQIVQPGKEKSTPMFSAVCYRSRIVISLAVLRRLRFYR